jgi:hypothetical protein
MRGCKRGCAERGVLPLPDTCACAHLRSRALDESLQGAKGKTLQKEIGHYCSALVEALEEDLAAAVRAESFNASQTHELLCKTLSNACRGPQVR